MSQLRKEYKEFKQIQEQNFREAAEAWTEENVILINERLNRNAIWRLNSAIQRFDSKFGKYRDRLPAIAEILNNAENGLNLVITGKVGSRSAAQMLQRMSIIYNILSNFFGGDLGALLKTPAFRVAHETPDEKIDKIIDQGHNVKEIRRNLAAALKPSDDERVIFRRAYKSFDMPTLDWNDAAKQLCCLSCNELKDLAGIQKVPMVVVDNPESGLDEAGVLDTASRVGGAVVGGTVAAGVGGITSLMNRFKARSAEMTAALDKLEKYISGVEGFQDIDAALKNLRNKSKSASNAQFDMSGGIRGLLRHPSVIVMKQAVMATEAIEGVLKAWNEHIKSTYKDGIKAEDLPLIKKELDKKIKGGIFSKIKNVVTGVKPAPGLSPDDIIKAVMFVASKDVAGGEQYDVKASGMKETANPNKKNLLLEMHENVSGYMLTEDYKDLEKLVQQIGTFEKTPSGKVEDALQKDIAAANQQSGAAPAAAAAGQEKGADANLEDTIEGDAEEAAADQDLTQEDLQGALAGVQRLRNENLETAKPGLKEELNSYIAEQGIDGVKDIDTAEQQLKKYQSILVNDEKYVNLISAIGKWENIAKQEIAAKAQAAKNAAGAQPQAAPAAAPATAPTAQPAATPAQAPAQPTG